MTGVSTRLVLSIALVVTAVGVADSVISKEWDFLVVFLLLAAVQLVLWMRQREHRRVVSLRPDLADWLERRSETSGEPFDDVLDRAVAWFKHGLYSEADNDS